MISHIVEGIKSQLHGMLAGQRLPSFGIGEAAAKEFKSPPSIVFVPVGERIGPPVSGAGGEDAPSIATRLVEVWARIYDKSIDHCEETYGNLVGAIQDVLTRGSYDLLGGEWDTSGATADGMVFAAKMVFKIPLTRAPDKLAVVVAAPITAEINAQVDA